MRRPWTRRTTTPAAAAPAAAPVLPDRIGPALPGVRAAVHASPRLEAALAREWHQVPLVAGVVPQADVALVEVGDEVPVPEGLDARGLGPVPLVVWATAGAPRPEHTAVLDLARQVYVALGSDLPAWRAVVPSARLLPPAASGRLLPTPPSSRHGVAVVAVGRVAPEPAALTAAVLTRGLRTLLPPPAAGPGPLRLARPDRSTRLPRALTKVAPEVTEPAGVAPLLGSAAVMADGPRRSVDDTWALLEAAASGAAVVGLDGLTGPAGLPVPTASEHLGWRGELVARLHQPELRDRESVLLRRGVRHGHALSDRVAHVLDAVGVDRPHPRRTVSAIVATNRRHELDTVLANVGRQSHPSVELVLVLHGFEVDQGELKDRATAAGVTSLTVVEAAPELTLGACLNLGVDAAGGDYLAKLDDDNHYGTHYLADLVDAFGATGAGVVGKWAHHVWLRASGAVVLRYPDAEHTYQRRVQGGSMVFEGDLLRRMRFGDLPRGVDTDVLDRVLAERVPIWSGDRFNFVSVRASDTAGHTWTASDASFLTASGRLLFHGDPRTHVEV